MSFPSLSKARLVLVAAAVALAMAAAGASRAGASPLPPMPQPPNPPSVPVAVTPPSDGAVPSPLSRETPEGDSSAPPRAASGLSQQMVRRLAIQLFRRQVDTLKSRGKKVRQTLTRRARARNDGTSSPRARVALDDSGCGPAYSGCYVQDNWREGTCAYPYSQYWCGVSTGSRYFGGQWQTGERHIYILYWSSTRGYYWVYWFGYRV